MPRFGRAAVFAILVLATVARSSPAAAQGGADVVDLATRPGVTVRMLVLTPAARPRAAAVLLPGSEGVSDIPEDATPDWTRGGSFLVRASPYFAAHGVAAAIVDSPSDRPRGLTIAFRASEAHVADVAAAIAALRQRTGTPVWLVAHSSGAISAANVAARLLSPQGPDGVVLASSVAYPLGADAAGTPAGRPPGMAAIRVPVLLIHAPGDACTSFGSAQLLRRTLVGAPRAALVAMDARPAPGERRCGRFAAHGFNGIEEAAVAAMVDWMERQ